MEIIFINSSRRRMQIKIELGFYPTRLNHARLWQKKAIISFGETIASPTKVGLCRGALIIKLGCKCHKPVLRSTKSRRKMD
jgi:hypothetical protein